MPTNSLYAFKRNHPSDAGEFWQNHVGHASGGWAWSTIFNLPNIHSVLSWERQDNELLLDLGALANNPIVLGLVDSMLTAPVSRAGRPLRTSYVTWANVNSAVRAANPTLHHDWELLATLNIDFHVSTPWYCSDADGTITYYIFFFIDGAGHLRGDVQGWSYHFDGGGPFCAGAISDGLNSAVPGGMGPLQSQLNTGLSLFSGSHTFSMIYFLPGHGSRSGFSSDNADNNVSLAVLPQ
jgi:hypothetical protein